MDNKSKEIALFRLSVLGPLASRARFERGELNKLFRELGDKHYNIPYSKQTHISHKTIERWYYCWFHGGFDALLPTHRIDLGGSHIAESIQQTILELKKSNPSRSLNTIKYLLEEQGLVAKNEISRASLHRFLKRHNLSKRTVSDAATIERRSFEAVHAGDIWHGDVMHGPTIMTPTGKKKVYLVSLMDDASRLIAHSAFCFGETALDIEGVLKQALLKRGIPRKIIIDNGAAYRAHTLQLICARLGVRLVYCRPYEPEGKGKLERWHRTFRSQFLAELLIEKINGLDDLNARLWSWLERVYHAQPHHGLAGHARPIDRWRHDLIHIQPLGTYANNIDDYFNYRVKRRVKKDGTVTWEGAIFEVPYALTTQHVHLVVDPHTKRVIKVESLTGEYLGEAHPLDKLSNCHRRRQRPTSHPAPLTSTDKANVVELAHEAYQQEQIIRENTSKRTAKEEE